MIHYNITIKGRVQGVNYRDSAKTKAQELGITGFVKNKADGSVYMEAEGPEDKLLQLADWCHYGPSRAKVDSVELETGKMKMYDNFQIKF